MNSADIITVAELHPTRTLCITGNGFDIMHGVPSSYRGFRDALPRRSELRQALEMYIRKDDIWGNFEDSLAYLDRETMMSSLDDCLAIMGVLDANDEDFSAADFFAALEMTVAPAQTITRELPNRFRQWVLTLKPTANTPPLKQLLHPEMNYINFNYTEFLEALYEIPKGNILYITAASKSIKKLGASRRSNIS